jgi:hypothetical protein
MDLKLIKIMLILFLLTKASPKEHNGLSHRKKRKDSFKTSAFHKISRDWHIKT